MEMRYFSAELRLADLDRESLQGFVTWLAHYRGDKAVAARQPPGEKGRLARKGTVIPPE
ncbi:MAG TPA: hypothetical protein VMS60_00400 [Solirubrobacterales bacterium]|nr:hypothetical protein [Solirubrobacterales bacterium]